MKTLVVAVSVLLFNAMTEANAQGQGSSRRATEASGYCKPGTCAKNGKQWARNVANCKAEYCKK